MPPLEWRWLIYLVTDSCPSRSSRYLCVVVFWSYLTITGNALLVKAIYVTRTPVTKYILSCGASSSTSTRMGTCFRYKLL
jgi:hypothetical protein